MNKQNLISNSERTPRKLKEMGKKGGIKSGEVRRQKKLLKAILLDDLYTVEKNGFSHLELICKKCLQKLYNEVTIKDLEVLARLIGETKEQTLITTPQIIVHTQEDKELIEEVKNLEL